MTYQVSARLMREMKRKFDRLGMEGKIHTEDYFEYFNITDKQRYVKGEI
jgi:serine/threonine protein kinase HipA of HipAB toxin-antitoxin module